MFPNPKRLGLGASPGAIIDEKSLWSLGMGPDAHWVHDVNF